MDLKESGIFLVVLVQWILTQVVCLVAQHIKTITHKAN